MSKLLKLKDWMTLGDSARHLSDVLSESVTESDLLRLGIDGKIVLSIHIVSQVYGRLGSLIPIEDVKIRQVRSIFAKDDSESVSLPDAEPISETQAVRFDREDFVSLKGVWDIAMFGHERSLVEDRYQSLTGNDGAYASLYCWLDGVILRNGEVFAKLYDAVEKYLGDGEKWRPRDDRDFYPSADLPDGAAFVIRTSVLTDFVGSLSEDSPKVDQSPKKIRSDREQNLLRVIAALWAMSELPKEHNVAADKLSALMDGWSWDKPVAGTIADTILKEAANLPGAKIRS